MFEDPWIDVEAKQDDRTVAEALVRLAEEHFADTHVRSSAAPTDYLRIFLWLLHDHRVVGGALKSALDPPSVPDGVEAVEKTPWEARFQGWAARWYPIISRSSKPDLAAGVVADRTRFFADAVAEGVKNIDRQALDGAANGWRPAPGRHDAALDLPATGRLSTNMVPGAVLALRDPETAEEFIFAALLENAGQLGIVGSSVEFAAAVPRCAITPEALRAAREAAGGYVAVSLPKAWTTLQAIVLEAALAYARTRYDEDEAECFAIVLAKAATVQVEALARRLAAASIRSTWNVWTEQGRQEERARSVRETRQRRRDAVLTRYAAPWEN